MRLIDANALIEAYLEEQKKPGIYSIAKIIMDAPTVDAVSVKHGWWDATGRYKFPSGAIAVRCSECGAALRESEFHLYNWNYCPVCGAKMDGLKQISID